MNKQELIDFENEIVDLFHLGKIPYPIHFSGGNEDSLIKMFKEVKQNDWVFSTHRSHYHYLLKGGSPKKLKEMIIRGDSLHVFDKSINFFSSAIVAGACTIATGTSLAIQRQKTNAHVWCFIGDGAEEEGSFYESVRYVDGNNLPCTFVIEDNNLSVDTPKEERLKKDSNIKWPDCVVRYNYIRKYPHVQTGKFVKEYM